LICYKLREFESTHWPPERMSNFLHRISRLNSAVYNSSGEQQKSFVSARQNARRAFENLSLYLQQGPDPRTMLNLEAATQYLDALTSLKPLLQGDSSEIDTLISEMKTFVHNIRIVRPLTTNRKFVRRKDMPVRPAFSTTVL